MKQYKATQNVTIGNGKGRHSFSTNGSYTEKFLKDCALTLGQIKHYFTSDKKAK